MDASSCYGGGDVAGAVFGTLFAVVILGLLGWWLYKKYMLNKSKELHLVTDDPESIKGEYAFDNPAFRSDANKTTNPLDPNWTSKNNSMDKRKTVDDSCINGAAPRLVSLRGSDFTGLGIEVCGGLKEGMFVKKVMPQGPAANVVNTGDRITSITIDFRNIVLEDAMTILSYASPYNVQLELVDVKGNVATASQSPKSGHTPLTHPLYRSSSLSDHNTIERNSRKQLFQNDDNNYPTLKMENPQPNVPINKVLPTVHIEKEKEKKNSFSKMKDMIEEKFQTKSDPDKNKVEVERKPPTNDEGKKGLKFGIRVFPPAVNEKIFGKSPAKVQADNENNANIEKIETVEVAPSKSPSPPVVKKRNKDIKVPVPDVIDSATEFQRQNSITSSGIKRDADGIPQEVPSHMMQAAMAAKDNRKSGSNLMSDRRKGKAPKPPVENDADISTETVITNLSMDMTDSVLSQTKMVNGALNMLPESDMKHHEKLNFSDNFAEEVFNQTIDSISGIEHFDDKRPSNSSTPKSERKKSSLTESQIIAQEDEHESDSELTNSGKQIELNSSDITVHQASPVGNEDEMCEDGSRRTASLGDLSKFEHQKMTNGSNNNTLERAQSLEMTDSVQNGTNVATKKRKATVDIQIMENKEPKLMSAEGMDTLQRGRLKAAYEWGNLEDAFNSGELLNSSSETEIKSSNEEIVEKKMEDVRERALEIVNSVVDIINEKHNHDEAVIVDEIPIRKDEKNEVQEFLELEREQEEKEHISLTPVNVHFNIPDPMTTTYIIENEHNNKPDHVKIASYDTNIPDDVKVSRYPFGSLERPKSDVLKKILGQKEELENTPSIFVSDKENKITIENTFLEVEPISLTLVNNDTSMTSENDQTESSQASPVFTSNTQGVSSINISSLDVDLKSAEKLQQPFTMSNKFSIDNIVTISTESSQPSSIIMIDDEKLDFSLQTLDDFNDSMENMSSDLNTTVLESNPDENNFITEITVKSNEVNGKMEEKEHKKEEEKAIEEPEEKKNDVHYIPRNAEIKFTTSTYESPLQKNYERRISQIEQIRSNFERSNSSEIPVPVRKSSIPTSIKTSPSRIPVFNSSKIALNNNGSDSQQRSPPSYRNIINNNVNNNNNNNNNNTNKVSVSITSIKNQSRNPSGK